LTILFCRPYRGRVLPVSSKGRCAGLLLAAALLLCACAPLRGTQRAAVSVNSCIHAAIKDLPHNIPDKQAHCRAAALIAEQCSIPEAYLAGVGKEVMDLFDGGDAEWGDLRADWYGVRCARGAGTDDDAVECCKPIQGIIEGPKRSARQPP
jgi:hypothetical protein